MAAPATLLLALFACFASLPAWPNGDGFFRSTEIPGNPEYVIFGNVRSEDGQYLKGAIVRVYVAQHMVELTATTDVIGRFRTPDVGLAIQDLGYEVDLSLITITVELPGFSESRRENRGKYRQKKGAVEINFRMKKNGGK